MKLLVALSGLMVVAHACLQVHTGLNSDPFRDDVMQIQIFEGDGQLVCSGGGSKFSASDQDWFEAYCPDTGYRAAVTANGRVGWVENIRTGTRS
jgi:hypothetical protein